MEDDYIPATAETFATISARVDDWLTASIYNGIDTSENGWIDTTVSGNVSWVNNGTISATEWADPWKVSWQDHWPPPKRKIGSPNVLTKRRRTGLGHCDAAEQKARDLLSRFIGLKRFKRYMRDGFINHAARSGKIYQIFPSHGHTSVWENGKIVEKLCLCVSGLPPTDSVVMRLLLLQHSEDTFRYHENVRVWMKAPDRRVA